MERGHLQQGRVRSLQPRPNSNVEKVTLLKIWWDFFLPQNKQSRLLYPHDGSDSRLIVKTIMFIRNNYHFLWQFPVSRCHFQLSNMKLLWIIIHNGTFLLLAVMSLSAFAVKKEKRKKKEEQRSKNVYRKNPPGYTHLPSAQGWSGGQKKCRHPIKALAAAQPAVRCWAFVTVKRQVSTPNNHECANIWWHANPSKETELVGYERKRGGRSRDDFFFFFFPDSTLKELSGSISDRW